MKEIAGASLHLETDFFRRRNNRSVGREKKMRSLQVKAGHVLLVLLIIISLAFAVYSAGHFFADWSVFQVASFRIANIPVQEKQEVQEILATCRGNIFFLDLAGLRRHLLSLRTVQEVVIRRDLPATLEISFKLRQPVFQYKKKGGFVSFDAEGVELYNENRADPGLIQIRETALNDLPEVFSRKEGIMARKERLAYISFRPGLGLVVKLKGIDEILFLGENMCWQRIDDYLRIKKVLPYHFQGVRYADLRLPDRVYFESLEGGDQL